MNVRLAKRLAHLEEAGRSGFVPFIMAGDPDVKATESILTQLPRHGADIIELGMPFSDPMADGPTIQAAAQRALKNEFKTDQLFQLIKDFRETDNDTPIILMGYFNTVFKRGVERFMQDASTAGADGLIIVDIPIEERAEIQEAAAEFDIDIITLIAPTSLESRLEKMADYAEGFVYYIAVKGITGDKSADMGELANDIETLRKHIATPIAVGFGIKSREDVADVAKCADLVVVGSRIVQEMETNDDSMEERVLNTCKELSSGVRK
ncbi:MAG: tryptophan synthase subunit alpha [Rickettsiales bacterium]|nr:tryptophan synthase subunit alpha [Rickettsiales bacterium]